MANTNVIEGEMNLYKRIADLEAYIQTLEAVYEETEEELNYQVHINRELLEWQSDAKKLFAMLNMKAPKECEFQHYEGLSFEERFKNNEGECETI